jgi:hypothetical protein
MKEPELLEDYAARLKQEKEVQPIRLSAGGGPLRTAKPMAARSEEAPEAAGVGIGVTANGIAAPTVPKRGGIAGGGKSGDVTSPASRAGRNLMGGARIKALQPMTGTASVGGSIGRAIPVLGTGLMLLDFFRLTRSRDLPPEDDSSRIY